MSGLWDLLSNRKCAITRIPSDRWSLERFGHPRHGERGRSYTWAAGVLDDVWGFDPGAFGLSPREAEQMDPQQRLLLELTWEALEDAGIKPSDLAGTETGVFVGASTLDHANSRFFDYAATDGYFATGNAASILANRVSYVFDLNGPSFMVDTACSSSLVALDAAVQALQSGRIDTAIVGGVSILLAPFQFISFSQASMLSRAGLCQAFSASADGYVRAEGGGVLVLRSSAALRPGVDRAKARIVASRINSDGRTNGIALPSKQRQAQLLEQLYSQHGLDPDHLAFVEAHGTGTPVGDPVEATALGEVLGRKRDAPLPIGSVKSNIGHSEAAAGLAGLIKAMLALEHDLLPPTLHCDDLNPNIDFARLNLHVARDPVPLARTAAPRLAGVSSYGFGGTNAHVVLTDAPRDAPVPATAAPLVLMLSAHTRSALAALARDHAERLDRGDLPAGTIVAAANNRRDALAERLVVPLDAGVDVVDALRAFAAKGADAGPEAVTGTAVARRADVAFVYSGNGSQWVGMGRAAYRTSAAFRAGLDEVDALFQGFAGWSLAATLNAADLADQLGKTSVAQPLIFAIQAAATRTLRALGLAPSFVLGHSVGEVAAAEAAGALDLGTAVKVIYYRSLHQELAFGAGGMAVLIGSRESAEALAAAAPDLSIAAYNSPRTITFSGTSDALQKLAGDAKGMRARVQKLDIPYPFHSGLIAAIEEPLLADLGDIPARDGSVTFVSTVTGAVHPGRDLDRTYWWRNVREPVLFSQAIEEAARLGARVFVEVGPSPILLSHINDTLGARGDAAFAAIPTLERKDGAGDPFRRTLAAALARGARVDEGAVFGSDPGPIQDLPTYPWQKKPYRLGETTESAALLAPRPWHPLVGARTGLDQLEWHGVVDVTLVPALADHVVDGHVLLPGAAFAEMALAVARDWLAADKVAVADFEIHQPMVLDGTSSRETRCRVQPVTGFLEIMSRPRLTQGTWQVHATAKVLRFVGTADPMPSRPDAAEGEGRTGADLYPAAAASGLQYGPAFQLLGSARRSVADAIAVDLVEGVTDARFGFDPARVDACFHGLVLLFSELAVRGHLKPYVPVAIAELKLFRPGDAIARGLIEVRRADGRTIVVDLSLLNAAGEVVASLYGMRFQAMNAFRSADRMIDLVGSKVVLAAEPLAVHEDPSPTAAQVVDATRATGRMRRDGFAPAADYVLLEGWATSAAFGLFEAWAEDGDLDVGALVVAGRLPGTLRDWCGRLLAALAQSGLVSRAGPGRYTVSTGADLPAPRDVLRTLAVEHPDRSAELLLACRADALVDALAAGRPVDVPPYTLSALDAHDYGGRAAVAAADLVAAVLDRLDEALPKDRALRVLQVGDGPLSVLAADFAARRSAELTVLEPDRRRFERVRLALDGRDRVTVCGDAGQLPPNGFDLVVAAQSLHAAVRDPAKRGALAESLAPGAVLLAVEPEASLFRDLVFGLSGSTAKDAPAVASEAAWRQVLDDMGLGDVAVLHPAEASAGLLCIGRKADERVPRAVKGDALVIGSEGPLGGAAAALATMLKFSGLKVVGRTLGLGDEPLSGESCGTIIWMVQAPPTTAPADAIARRCLALRRLAADLGGAKATLWVVCPGATRAGEGDAVEAAVWAFARTLANEVQTLDVRLVDLAPGLSAEVAARRLRDVVLSETAETEIVLDASSTSVLRLERVPLAAPVTVAAADAVLRLVKGEQSGLDRMTWAAEARRAPGSGEVEVAVGAAGLNFRDVMWGLSILPEEILEDGYAGATLGLECAGTIVRVGPGVDRFKAGDRVMAFAKAALATHATVDASVVAAIPDDLSMEAAATVPVTFLTAFYALIRCARLQEDEWVLIHGGAGGVGLAALQIALWRGARVIATAGSAERRDLLAALGADHVFDSRSSQFVDDIRAVTKGGVDVVLNSLSGEAMERSIAVLRPFGRFVELGKRDYVANTHIGLKPFRRNLSYFGVDLDQLILKGDATGRTLFEDVMALFEDGSFSPLPYRVFPARETVDAFRVMQKSGHVGKIVILPPAVPERIETGARPFTVESDRTHLITGGLRGFGLETAHWLVERGARHLVLLGRSGPSTPEAREAIERLRADGVTVEAAAVDVADEAAMATLLTRVAATMPPLCGVIHAATVYDDAIVANLTRDRLDAVLTTKVTGAVVLDRLTRSTPLDYFILYSSATTLIGNPGQGAYVAANAFLEGLARRRRQEGLPAFAVAWGAIEDVGVLARSGSTATNLLARTGVQGMTARAALNRLADALSQDDPGRGGSGLAIASVNWSTAREHLPVLRGPVFSSLMQGAQASESGGASKVVIRDLVERDGLADATLKIAEAVQEEIARILRLPREDVSRNKPLMEIGLDSLMAVELGMGLEQRFALDAPLSTSAGAMTVNELADHVVGLSGAAGLDQASDAIGYRHLDAELREEVMKALPGLADAEGSARSGLTQ